MRTCDRCLAGLPDEAVFCPICGTRIQPTTGPTQTLRSTDAAESDQPIGSEHRWSFEMQAGGTLSGPRPRPSIGKLRRGYRSPLTRTELIGRKGLALSIVLLTLVWPFGAWWVPLAFGFGLVWLLKDIRPGPMRTALTATAWLIVLVLLALATVLRSMVPGLPIAG